MGIKIQKLWGIKMAYVKEEIVLKFYLEQIKNDNVIFLKGKDNF